MTKRLPAAAIAGWSATGKTRFARALAERLRPLRAVVLSLDDYYRDTSHLSREERGKVDYDEPSAWDLPLFRRHFEALRAAGRAPRLAYDFRTGARREAGVLGPADAVIVEGLLVLWDSAIREAAALRIFLDGDPERLLARRVLRDGRERAYTPEEVRRRFEEMVLPAQRRYLEGAARRADLVFGMDWGEEEAARAAARFAGDTSAFASPAARKGTPT